MKDFLGTLQHLPPEFCRKYGIKPFIMDVEENIDSILFYELMENIEAGYDVSRPLVLAQGPADLQGLVIDGKHRLCCIYALEESGIKIRPHPSILYEPISSMDQYHARVAHYVMLSKSKDGKLARRIIAKNLSEIINPNYAMGDKLPDYITGLGFLLQSTIKNVISMLRKERAGKPRKVGNKHGADISNLGDWGTVRMLGGTSDGVYARPSDQLDVIATQKVCPGCGIPLVIVTKTDGRVMEMRCASEAATQKVNLKNGGR
jgi:hypothetical protein